jgi:hypothetical protein
MEIERYEYELPAQMNRCKNLTRAQNKNRPELFGAALSKTYFAC